MFRNSLFASFLCIIYSLFPETSAEDQDYICFSANGDTPSVSSTASSLSRSESYVNIQEMLRQHSRRCSTGEINKKFRMTRRQSESMMTFMALPETCDSVGPARPVSSKKLTKCSNTSQKNECDTPQTSRDDSNKRCVGRNQMEGLTEKALLEKERQRQQLDNLVDSLPVRSLSGMTPGTCPFAQQDTRNDANHALIHSDHVNSQSDEGHGPSDIDHDVPVCPVSGLKGERRPKSHNPQVPDNTNRVGNFLLHAVTRSISSHNRDDYWNSLMCVNSSGASSQEASSDEDIPPLIHHEHITYTSPLAGQRAWPACSGNASSEHRPHLTNGTCVSPNILHSQSDTDDARNDTSGHNSADRNPEQSIFFSDNTQHSSDLSFSPIARKLGLADGCPVVHSIHHSQSNCTLPSQNSSKDILTNLDRNGSAVKPYLRTRSSTISTALGCASSPPGGCDCLLQRRHSASGKLSQCWNKTCDGRQRLGSRRLSESEADLMSFSSLSSIHNCCRAIDGGPDIIHRNLLDASLPDLHYQSLLETDFRTNAPSHISTSGVA